MVMVNSDLLVKILVILGFINHMNTKLPNVTADVYLYVENQVFEENVSLRLLRPAPSGRNDGRPHILLRCSDRSVSHMWTLCHA